MGRIEGGEEGGDPDGLRACASSAAVDAGGAEHESGVHGEPASGSLSCVGAGECAEGARLDGLGGCGASVEEAYSPNGVSQVQDETAVLEEEEINGRPGLSAGMSSGAVAEEEIEDEFGNFDGPDAQATLDSGASEAEEAVEDDDFGAFEDVQPTLERMDATAVAPVVAETSSDDGFGDFAEESFCDFEEPPAPAETAVEEEKVSGRSELSAGMSSGFVYEEEKEEDEFGNFDAPDAQTKRGSGASEAEEAVENDDDFGAFEDVQPTLERMDAPATTAAPVVAETSSDDGFGDFAEESFGEFEEPPAPTPAVSDPHVNTLLGLHGTELSGAVEAAMEPLRMLPGVLSCLDTIDDTHVTGVPPLQSPSAAAFPPGSIFAPGGLLTVGALHQPGEPSSVAGLSYWKGTDAETEFLHSVGLSRAAITAGASLPIHREASLSGVGMSALARRAGGSGHELFRDRSVSAGQLSVAARGSPSSPGDWGVRGIAAEGGALMAGQSETPRSQQQFSSTDDPFAASGPVMCLSEYLSPVSDKRSAAAAREDALPAPGGPAEDGSEFDPFGVFMAVQAAKNTAMPGVSPSSSPASVRVSPAAPGRSPLAPGPGSLSSPIPEAALGIEPGSMEGEGGGGGAQLPVSISVPRPPRSTHDSEDWDTLFQGGDSAVSALFPEETGTGGGESMWEAVKARGRHGWGGGAADAKALFGSVEAALAAMPDLSYMLGEGRAT